VSEASEKEDARRKAVALRYDAQQNGAPQVVAKGSGYIADRIIEIAREHGVPIHDDPDLVAVLAKLDLGTEIPDSLYRAVAEVLAFVYKLNKDFTQGSGAQGTT
jgi:flagellar biosynthesis protein